MNGFTLRLTRRCTASAEQVYDLLTDPASHLDWGGRRQTRRFRITSLDTTVHRLEVGSRFRSTGRVFLVYPTTDESTVTAAEPGRALEFVTENRYCRSCTGRYRNRYDLEPTADGGTLVSYTFQRLAMERPPPHMRGPMRLAIQRFGAPRLFGRGLDNLVASAERRAHVTDSAT